MRKQSIVDLLN